MLHGSDSGLSDPTEQAGDVGEQQTLRRSQEEVVARQQVQLEPAAGVLRPLGRLRRGDVRVGQHQRQRRVRLYTVRCSDIWFV